ncbi:glycosyltransferase [Methanosarcina sp. Mfa9]|uniref:glycosyltransferase n=1 Tax=Methanosarcina sp. Mfa9 TaxID=3439063 RepID=UPI003F859326
MSTEKRDSMRRLKVLILPSSYPSKENPVKGIFFKEQAEALNQYVDVAVLSVDIIRLNQPKKVIHAKRKSICKENGLLTFRLNYVNWTPKSKNLSNKLYEKKVVEGYEEIVKIFGKPDIIHAHISYPAGYGAMILSKKFKIPFMVTEHATFFEDKLMTKYNNYTTKVLKNADYYSAVGSNLKDKINKAGREQCEVIPNFINMDKFNLGKKSQIRNHSNIFNLINVSVMTDKKGIDVLLRALHQVTYDKGYQNIHLNLIGSGPEKQKYEHLSRELGLINYCTFHGRLNDDDLVKYMNLSDALVISSRIETFGVVGIEAMASGIPVIATRCGGPEGYVRDKVGLLVEKENVNSLAEGIIEIINNYDKYDADSIKEYVHKNYSSEAVCEKIMDIYKKLIR